MLTNETTWLEVFLMKSDKYNLTDTQLAELLLVTRVVRGLKLINEECDNEAIPRSERFPSEKSIQISRNDEIPVKK